MRTLLLAAVAVLAGAVPAVADDAKPDPVVVTARVRSLLDLTGYAEYLGGLVGQGDPAKQAAQLVRGLADPDEGIEGIDPKRPIGLYGVLTPDAVSSYAVVVVPVADEMSVMELISGRLNLEPKKVSGGVYELKVKDVPVPVFFRFANKSAYITARSADPLTDNKLVSPSDLFAGEEAGAAVVRLYPGRVPEPLRRVGLGFLELQLAQQTKDRANGSKPASPQAVANEWGRRVGQQAAFAVLKALALETTELTARVGIDPAADELSAEIVIKPKEGSEFAKVVSNASGLTGFRPQLERSDVVATVGVRFDLPTGVQKSLDSLIDSVSAGLTEGKAEEGKEAVKSVLEALAPSLKSRVVDLGLVVAGNKLGSIWTLVEVRAVKGRGIPTALKAVDADDLSPGAKFEFDTDKQNGVTLHVLTMSGGDDLKKFSGGSTVRVGTSVDRLLFAVGPDNSILKQVVHSDRGPVPVVSIVVSAGRLLSLTDDKLPREAVDKLMAGADGKDTVRLAVTGGDAATVRLTVKGGAVKLATAFDEAKKNQEK